ncbi:MAG TPA: geranylgeranyl pyrophosphate synthase [Propionibacteriaceae bacterium]|nr:polyprenyl synthetase family protein [Micropruina sp.]HBX81668.1 geranylgeranyl pyrophosphate synthase [Propionibacteriaceae bacterium]HBY24281.1 geranylgeranyl pyrophosphate synthase [Propionibacteriaceae bacterium]
MSEVDEALDQRIRELLAEVETALYEAAVANTPFVTEAATHIISAGGKRFRPLLVALASQLHPGAVQDEIIRAAMVCELTHVASLYHDDVMDEAELRRGAPAANRRWDNTVAIMVGDFLFSRASSIVATLGTDYVLLQANTFARLVQGQIAETRGVPEGIEPLHHYLDVVADKTGSLIATSAVFGGMVCGAPADQLEALAAFGEEIGVVFQLADDLIDIESDVTGKTPGTDLREGVWTLPTLLAGASEDPADGRLKQFLGREIPDPVELAEALALMRAHPALEQARIEIRRRADAARAHLEVLPEGPARDGLAALCDQVVERSS